MGECNPPSLPSGLSGTLQKTGTACALSAGSFYNMVISARICHAVPLAAAVNQTKIHEIGGGRVSIATLHAGARWKPTFE
jgi:hypothetical protein